VMECVTESSSYAKETERMITKREKSPETGA
jgi:hypothetical protein